MPKYIPANNSFPFVTNATNATNATIAENIKVTDESTDTSCNVLFVTAATGELPPKSGTNLTFNSNTGRLTTTEFLGNVDGAEIKASSFVGTPAISDEDDEVCITLSEAKTRISRRRFNVTTSTDGNHEGDVVYFGSTTSMTVGKIYHYKNNGTWEKANADDASTSDGLLAVALGVSSDNNGMLIRGMVTLDHDPGAIGDVLYLQSDNAGTVGEATSTAPSATGDCVRIIGYCVDASNGQIWFNPDNHHTVV